MVEDLLGDADPEITKKFTNETTELANLSNQIGTLTKQTQELKIKKSSAEQELTTLSSQKHHIEGQLASLRAAYEREAEQLKQAEDQLAKSKNEMMTLRGEYRTAEQSYTELQSRKQEMSSHLESDRRENENLNQRMRVINQENINLRQELEKLQCQARQQRGMVAINKKQVSTGEVERERLKGEIDDTRSNVASPPPPSSPTPSQASLNNNPFHRRPPAAPDSAFPPSPLAPGNNPPAHATTLEDVFGPSFSAAPSLNPTSTGISQRSTTEGSAGPSAPSASEGPSHSTPPTPLPLHGPVLELFVLIPGPLPRFEGFNIPLPPPPTTSSPPPPPPSASQPAIPGPGMIRVPPLTPQDVEKFTGLFERNGAIDGYLPGDIAKGIFQRAKLPNQTLGIIWNLADRQHRGALGPAEFVVAMHLITCSKNGTLPVLPQILPPGLYEAAAGRGPTRNGDRRPAGRGVPPPAMPPVPPIPQQYSGPLQQGRAQSPRTFTPPVTQPVQLEVAGEWVITSTDKERFDSVFLTVDKQNKGYITGEEAVPFFSNSRLPEDVLAGIWDLADTNGSGRLSREEFAIAMHLIREQRNFPDGSGPLPEVLPPNLIPPSMRAPGQFAAAFEAPPPPVPPPPPKPTSQDLFELDFSSPAPQTSSAPPSTQNQSPLGPFDADVFGVPNRPAISPNSSGPVPESKPPMPQGPPNFFGPSRAFVPSSNFGQSMISPSGTGGSNHSAPPATRQTQSMVEDLLGDADPEITKKFTNETTELANLSNQIGTLTKQTQELKIKKSSAEQELTTLSSQKHHIEGQLASLRAAYEREAEQLKQAEDQLAKSKNEMMTLRGEYRTAEQSYTELQSRKQEMSSHLESDRRENENLNQRMRVINQENINLRQELEKLQCQARQQRGMVAINKKQVSTGEVERERLKGEIDDTRSNVASPPPPSSPTPSQASLNNNPFHRRPPAAPDSAFPPSPLAPGNNPPAHATTLEDVFGPSFSAAPSLNPTSTGISQRSTTEGSAGPSAPSASEGPSHSTPPTSPPTSYHNSPQTDAAPPGAASHVVPFPLVPISRADSVTSSVQVNPSASNQGDHEFSRPDTPTNWASSSIGDAPAKDRDSFVKPDDRRSSMSVRSDAGTESSAKAPFPSRKIEDRSPFAAPVERNTTGNTTGGDEQSQSGKQWDSFGSTFGTGGTIPGAFPSPIKPNPTGESVKSNRSRTSQMSRSDFQPMYNSGAKEDRNKDFDEAFKNLRSQEKQHTGGSGISSVQFNKEFPPIVEVGRDEDSDSDNEKGFEDNFNPNPVPSHTQPATTAPPPPTTSPAPTGPVNAPPHPVSAQQSPPSYVPGSKPMGGMEKGNFPAEYSGFLPPRSDAMKHEGSTPGGGNNAIGFPALSQSPAVPGNSNADVFGQGSSLFSSSPSSTSKNPPSSAQNNSMFSSSPPAASKSPVPAGNPPVPTRAAFGDDFDKEFGDLAEAKEVDDKADDNDFGTNSAFGDFDPVFDVASSKGNVAPGTAVMDDGFTDFDFNIDSPAGQPQQQEVKTASSQDWDAIFADLDTREPAQGQPPRTQTNGNVGGETSGDTRQQSGTGPDIEAGGVALGGGEDGGQLGEEEKVIKLTGMGFNRDSSVKALEKHGYNLDRVGPLAAVHLDTANLPQAVNSLVLDA
ncbi:hypothetical protein C7212DRAFT_348215 [Tuber magnatum]|uniref:EF-hand n=1 Tax=Tuber magnatum TaxID=42249 RepID=A0A317SFV1_9PEZI|nr:hypothetical protein C7212DRAFT_348215 [Tuber magnatum]